MPRRRKKRQSTPTSTCNKCGKTIRWAAYRGGYEKFDAEPTETPGRFSAILVERIAYPFSKNPDFEGPVFDEHHCTPRRRWWAT